jgi:hypothetical protein
MESPQLTSTHRGRDASFTQTRSDQLARHCNTVLMQQQSCDSGG